ncbi:hypothetical protein CS063_10200 [Sporanaerobium hydrogeniformans]|uniref:Uncharacterized protein n=1 Tax=Sporanaerobium hydrogeniformans TaxID=3072179 RepID=A0AC61DB33_9FIRM|nr:hypothetical protein [Sporanaerobium hydrogeniformans]PHV70454.1 hypothetical protein CS063_10200 [Sporanaerobium hydrogeniformans]
MSNYAMSQRDRAILRELAKKQYEYSQLPLMKQREVEWQLHNDLQGQKPMIHIEVDTFEEEIIKDRLQCESEKARVIERQLLHNMLNHEVVGDDQIVRDHYPIRWKSWFKLFGFETTKVETKDAKGRSIGHHFNYHISDLGDALPTLGATDFGVDKEATYAYKAEVEEIIGDILPVKIVFDCLYAVPTQEVVHMMGMENMLFSMYDYPDEFKVFMNRIADDYISYFKYLEEEGCILPTTGNQILGQGSLCYTKQLPNAQALEGKKVTTFDVWGFMDSQETVGISPAMFNEFIFPYYKKVANLYGRLSYGCCEPVHAIWEQCISKLPRLSKVSISPWCDEAFMAEQLRGSKVIYHRKPSPNFLGVGKELDEEAVREHITKTLQLARGCKLEITQRDVYTLEGNIPKVRRYVEIIRELIETHWQS